MKKYKIYTDKKETMHIDKAILIGLKDTDKVSLNIVGQVTLEEALDMINTVTYELLDAFTKTQEKLKPEIYQRAVLGFSLMIDKFFPEGIKTKFNGLTDEAIMKAQNEILLSKQTKS